MSEIDWFDELMPKFTPAPKKTITLSDSPGPSHALSLDNEMCEDDHLIGTTAVPLAALLQKGAVRGPFPLLCFDNSSGVVNVDIRAEGPLQLCSNAQSKIRICISSVDNLRTAFSCAMYATFEFPPGTLVVMTDRSDAVLRPNGSSTVPIKFQQDFNFPIDASSLASVASSSLSIEVWGHVAVEAPVPGKVEARKTPAAAPQRAPQQSLQPRSRGPASKPVLRAQASAPNLTGRVLKAPDDNKKKTVGDFLKKAKERCSGGVRVNEHSEVFGRTLLTHAILTLNKGAIKTLLQCPLVHSAAKDGGGWPPLVCAAWAGDIAVLRALVKVGKARGGLSVDDQGPGGMTALAVAAYSGDVEMVKCMLEAHADVNLATDHRDTPLSLAALQGDKPTVSLLLEKIASVEVTNFRGRTAVHQAVVGGHIGCLKALLEVGADPRAPDARGVTPLHLAAMYGMPAEMTTMLVEYGASLHARDARGWTPLFFSAARGDKEEVRSLLKAGAKAENEGFFSQGLTPAGVACLNGHHTVATELLAEYCSPASTSSLGAGERFDVIYLMDDGWYKASARCDPIERTLVLEVDKNQPVDNEEDPRHAEYTPEPEDVSDEGSGSAPDLPQTMLQLASNLPSHSADPELRRVLEALANGMISIIGNTRDMGVVLDVVPAGGKTKDKLIEEDREKRGDPIICGVTVPLEGCKVAVVRMSRSSNVVMDGPVSVPAVALMTAGGEAHKLRAASQETSGVETLNNFLNIAKWTSRSPQRAQGRHVVNPAELRKPVCVKWEELEEVQQSSAGEGHCPVRLGKWGALPARVAIKEIRNPLQVPFAHISPEVARMSSLSHTHILPYWAFCSEAQHIALISPALDHGDLEDLLFAQADVEVTTLHRIGLALDIAGGLAYMHSCGVLHGDISPGNILLFQDRATPLQFRCKITGYGLVAGSMCRRLCSRRAARYMAPELIDGGSPSRSSDTYSYSVLLWTILCRRLPFHPRRVLDGGACPPGPLDDLENIGVDKGARLKRALESCWVQSPGSRPSMAALLVLISALQSTI